MLMPMHQRMPVSELIKSVKEHVKAWSGYPAHGSGADWKSPFVYVEFLKSEPADTKTAYVDRFDIRLHCISEPTNPYSQGPVMDMIAPVEEAMTAKIPLPEPFDAYRVDYGGIQAVNQDETNEGHAVLDYSVYVQYALKIKTI